MRNYNELVNLIHELTDKFECACNRREQEDILGQFIMVAEEVTINPDCPEDYRQWMKKKMPEFKLLLTGLKSASEIMDICESVESDEKNLQ